MEGAKMAIVIIVAALLLGACMATGILLDEGVIALTDRHIWALIAGGVIIIVTYLITRRK